MLISIGGIKHEISNFKYDKFNYFNLTSRKSILYNSRFIEIPIDYDLKDFIKLIKKYKKLQLFY